MGWQHSQGKSRSCREWGCHQEESEEGEMVAGTVCLLVPRHCDTSCSVPAPCLPCNQHRVTAVSTRQASSSQALHPTPQRPSSTGGGAAMLLGGKEVGGRRLTAWHTECHGLSDSAVAPLPSRSRVLGPCPSNRAFPAQSPQHPQLTLHSSGDPGTVVDRSCPGQRLLAAVQEYHLPPTFSHPAAPEPCS